MIDVSIRQRICANWQSGCCKIPSKVCGNCKLVAYCSVSCQRGHWSSHRKECKSKLTSATWRPAWDVEARVPPWASPSVQENLHNPFGLDHFLWGNIPAYDVLQLAKHEGVDRTEDVNVLFAASGDLRHLVETVVNLPPKFNQKLRFSINDIDHHVAVRNIALLLFALNVDEGADSRHQPEAAISRAEDLLHLWYSAFVPATTLRRFEIAGKELVEEFCRQLDDLPMQDTHEKTWNFQSGATLKVSLSKENWLNLHSLFKQTSKVNYKEAVLVRKSICLAPSRSDYRDRWNFKESSPFMRLSSEKFRSDGLLLPFAHPRSTFTEPNPTLFQSGSVWLMNDLADPSGGWSYLETHRRQFLQANDWYGKLAMLISERLESFLLRLQTLDVIFEMRSTDILLLRNQLPNHSFCRIEVSNVCDIGYLGLQRTLGAVQPLLQTTKANRHATILMNFLNAVRETVKAAGPDAETPDVNFLFSYLPKPQLFTWPMEHNADVLRIWDARDLAADVESLFKRYTVVHEFDRIAGGFGLEMKKAHTILQAWPTRPVKSNNRNFKKDEFWWALGSSFTNTERNVEWRRQIS